MEIVAAARATAGAMRASESVGGVPFTALLGTQRPSDVRQRKPLGQSASVAQLTCVPDGTFSLKQPERTARPRTTDSRRTQIMECLSVDGSRATLPLAR